MWTQLIGWWLLIPIAVGGGTGAAIGRFEHKWKLGLWLTVAPPVLWFLLYQLASQTGCAGGDCMGPMTGLLFLGGITALVALVAFGIFIQAVFSNLTQ